MTWMSWSWGFLAREPSRIPLSEREGAVWSNSHRPDFPKQVVLGYSPAGRGAAPGRAYGQSLEQKWVGAEAPGTSWVEARHRTIAGAALTRVKWTDAFELGLHPRASCLTHCPQHISHRWDSVPRRDGGGGG